MLGTTFYRGGGGSTLALKLARTFFLSIIAHLYENKEYVLGRLYTINYSLHINDCLITRIRPD